MPIYRQVNEWKRHGLNTNDKTLSNWVIGASHDGLLPIYERMKVLMMAKFILHVDETYAQILKRSDNWLYKSVPSQGPTIILF